MPGKVNLRKRVQAPESNGGVGWPSTRGKDASQMASGLADFIEQHAETIIQHAMDSRSRSRSASNSTTWRCATTCPRSSRRSWRTCERRSRAPQEIEKSEGRALAPTGAAAHGRGYARAAPRPQRFQHLATWSPNIARCARRCCGCGRNRPDASVDLAGRCHPLQRGDRRSHRRIGEPLRGRSGALAQHLPRRARPRPAQPAERHRDDLRTDCAHGGRRADRRRGATPRAQRQAHARAAGQAAGLQPRADGRRLRGREEPTSTWRRRAATKSNCCRRRCPDTQIHFIAEAAVRGHVRRRAHSRGAGEPGGERAEIRHAAAARSTSTLHDGGGRRRPDGPQSRRCRSRARRST